MIYANNFSFFIEKRAQKSSFIGFNTIDRIDLIIFYARVRVRSESSIMRQDGFDAAEGFGDLFGGDGIGKADTGRTAEG